eukprot:gene5049-7046_t
MFRQVLLLALLAIATAFAPMKFALPIKTELYANCAEKLLDAKGRCPGETGYVPLLKEAPVDFAAFKASKAAAAASKSSANCPEKLLDAKGRCPGETGYVPLLKEAPVDFAAFQAAQKAKKAAEGK